MRWWSAVIMVALTAGACTPSTTSDPTTTADAALVTTLATPDGDVCRSGDLEFETDGLVAALGDVEADATRISQIRWDPMATCERLIISFATDSGAPATTVGLTGVSLFAFAALVRVNLPETMSGTAVADSWTDGGLVDRTYVVRDESDIFFIDIHGAADAAIAVRAFTTRSPATLVIDFISQPDLPSPVGATVSETAVVITPSPGSALYPFTVEAYAQPSMRSVRVQLSQGETITLDSAVSLSGASDAWQSLRLPVDDGPAGPATLFVGRVDINDRQLEGALVPLDLP